ncbi:hypothetical protein Q1695_003611 [Nippostrongylus brasiliensis]|nr:hypothetical protein Q1695_003611 [Nippostrongylus brasiliensis]
MGRIADILQDAGHDVTVLHPLYQEQQVPVVCKKAKKMLFALPEKLREELQPGMLEVWEASSISEQLRLLTTHTVSQLRTCDLLLGDNRTMQLLADEHFDAGITEVLGTCGYGIFDKVGIDHIISTTALGILDTMGDLYDLPRLPSITPSYVLPYNDRMTFLERTINFAVSCIVDITAYLISSEYASVWQRHGVTTLEDDYVARTNFLLSNTDEFLEFARPTTAKIVHIGGIALQDRTPLSKELQRIMDKSKGVVYMSFGSITPTKRMPHRVRHAILEVVKKFNTLDFIWKVDPDDSIEGISNLHTSTWLPQQAILAHPKLLCFVSHAGLNSVLELTRSGVPSILVPIFADQFRNARLVESKNTTIVIAKEDFNYEGFEAALRRIANDKSYSLRAQQLASLMMNKPFPLKDRLLSTVDFSIRHGKIPSMDIHSRQLNTLQFHSVDVVAFLSILSISVLYVSFHSCKYFFKKFILVKEKSE